MSPAPLRVGKLYITLKDLAGAGQLRKPDCFSAR